VRSIVEARVQGHGCRSCQDVMAKSSIDKAKDGLKSSNEVVVYVTISHQSVLSTI
jgi:hypothetical protein